MIFCPCTFIHIFRFHVRLKYVSIVLLNYESRMSERVPQTVHPITDLRLALSVFTIILNE